jgi:hypothetical protein
MSLLDMCRMSILSASYMCEGCGFEVCVLCKAEVVSIKHLLIPYQLTEML